MGLERLANLSSWTGGERPSLLRILAMRKLFCLCQRNFREAIGSVKPSPWTEGIKQINYLEERICELNCTMRKLRRNPIDTEVQRRDIATSYRKEAKVLGRTTTNSANGRRATAIKASSSGGRGNGPGQGVKLPPMESA